MACRKTYLRVYAIRGALVRGLTDDEELTGNPETQGLEALDRGCHYRNGGVNYCAPGLKLQFTFVAAQKAALILQDWLHATILDGTLGSFRLFLISLTNHR